MERLVRVVEAGGRLLRVDRVASAKGQLAAGLLLTFDVGRLLVEVDVAAGKIHSVFVESKEEVPQGAEQACEDEPWWRFIGCRLARAWPGEVGAQGLRLQFREDHDNPRVVSLVPSGSEVQVGLEPIGSDA